MRASFLTDDSELDDNVLRRVRRRLALVAARVLRRHAADLEGPVQPLKRKKGVSERVCEGGKEW